MAAKAVVKPMPVELHAIGTATNGRSSTLTSKIATWINTIPGIILAVQRQPGTNTIEIVNAVNKLLPRFRAIMPPAMYLTTEYDKPISIQQSAISIGQRGQIVASGKFMSASDVLLDGRLRRFSKRKLSRLGLVSQARPILARDDRRKRMRHIGIV
jgi:hypothetical protein